MNHAPPPLKPTDPSYRKPSVHHEPDGMVRVRRRQGARDPDGGGRAVASFVVASLAPDEFAALVEFAKHWSAP